MKMGRCMPVVDVAVIVETRLFPCAAVASLRIAQLIDWAKSRIMAVRQVGLDFLMRCWPDCARPLNLVLPCSDPSLHRFLETGRTCGYKQTTMIRVVIWG